MKIKNVVIAIVCCVVLFAMWYFVIDGLGEAL